VTKANLKKGSISILFLYVSFSTFSRDPENTKPPLHVGGAATVTNNGISFIPTFTLGKPAAIFDLSLGRKLTFEPQFRFALEGKPWSFIFWGRYKLVRTDKFAVNVGAHPAILFKTITETTDGVTKEYIRAQRNLAAEFSPNYFLTKNITVGMYYLYGYSLESYAVRNIHYLTLNANFYRISLPADFHMKFSPQIYYLNMDKQEGYYLSSILTLSRKSFPVSVSGLINKAIQTEIQSKDLVWNLSLIYSFGNEYVRK
jgi:hypothetical protein